MKPLEVIWFENISLFSEQVFGLGPLRVSMKQLLYTFLAIALAMSMLNFAKNPMLAVAIPAFLLMLAYARPYGMGMEELLIDMVSFFGKRKHIGTGEEPERKDSKKDRKEMEEKEEKEEEREGRGEEEIEAGAGRTVQIPATAVRVAEPATAVTAGEATAAGTAVPTATPATVSSATTEIDSSRNILHYIVPLSKDFNLEITEKEYVIATGESTIHISRDTADATISIEIRDNAVARITVNRR